MPCVAFQWRADISISNWLFYSSLLKIHKNNSSFNYISVLSPSYKIITSSLRENEHFLILASCFIKLQRQQKSNGTFDAIPGCLNLNILPCTNKNLYLRHHLKRSYCFESNITSTAQLFLAKTGHNLQKSPENYFISIYSTPTDLIIWFSAWKPNCRCLNLIKYQQLWLMSSISYLYKKQKKK